MFNNPYLPQYQQPFQQPFQQPYQQSVQVTKVNGENGAKAYQMPPNSSILLLDESAPVVWLKTTDGAGYPTLTPYDIKPAEPKKEPDIYAALEERIKKLEDRYNAESNNASTDRTANAGKSGPDQKRDERYQERR